MTDIDWRQYREQRVQQEFENVPTNVKENVFTAFRWAKNRLMRREGSGHIFNLVREKGGILCCFAKPQWSGDHCGKVMPTGALAIVRAVLEYENGL